MGIHDLGLKGIVIAHAPGTANTPRAHLVNPFALGLLRPEEFGAAILTLTYNLL